MNRPAPSAPHGGRSSSRFARTLASLFALIPAAVFGQPADSPQKTFNQYCVACHSESTASAGINLQGMLAAESASETFRDWEKVVEVLDARRMPPKGMPPPSDAERAHAAAWVRTMLREEAERAGNDPGDVTVRRLTSAEYAYTIQDLTGVELDVERNFAGDAVGGEGFTNYGPVQFMHDQSLESYLETAKIVADHAVVGAGPLRFSSDPGQSGMELDAIRRIHRIYREHGFRAVAAEGGRPFGLERYGKAFYATWRYAHRKELGLGEASLTELGAREDLSPRFVEHIWDVLNIQDAAFPTTEVIAKWRALPAPGADEQKVRAACTEIQEFVINYPRWLFGAGELAAGGAGDERALVLTEAAITAEPSADLRFVQRIRERGKASAYFSVEQANPRAEAAAYVIFRNPLVRDRDENVKPRPLRDLLDEETIARIGFGRMPDGTLLPPTDFAVKTGETAWMNIDIPKTARGFGFSLRAEPAEGTGDENILRILISETKDGSVGRPSWALLGNVESDSFRQWKDDVLAYAASFPQTSHGEPTPSDRDPIPPVFDNTYNQWERNWYHQRLKYYRDDAFLVEKMLDDQTRRKLDLAWTDLLTSFDFHKDYLGFVAEKFGADLGERSIEDIDEVFIAGMPAEARPHATALRREYRRMHRALREAQAGHLDDAVEFAGRAWRRPLADSEEEELRGFYARARENFELDHPRAIKALLTRTLMAPDFLYRLEQPVETTGAAPVSDWEMASRLSYFLWSSMPDEELRRAAEAGELSTEAGLRKQVERMAADPRTRRLAAEFFGQWLGFYRFDQYRGVDAKKFPEFTDDVKEAMYDEAVRFFEHVVREKRPIREIVSADYTFLNKALAEHYRLEREVDAEDELVLVEGVGEENRGGLLRLGAVLTATSAPLRTSPVKRGDWLLRRVVGQPTPPPPPNVPEIPADDKAFGEMTVRQQLDQHRTNPACAACHTRIDPMGFPLEHFDAVGRWRDTYANGQPIDDSSTLADGTYVSGLDALIDHLEQQDEQVIKTMSYKLIGYALGRTVQLSDQPLVEELMNAGGDASFADLAVEIVTSPQFRYRRGRDAGGEVAAGPPDPVATERKRLDD